MDLQQVVVSDVEPAVPHHAFALVNDSGQVETLIDIIHVETVVFHVLCQILCVIAVIADLERIDLIFLNQIREPSEAVTEVNKILSGWCQQSALDVSTIRHAIPGFCFVDALGRQEELGDHVQLPGFLDHDAAGRQVCSP